MADQEKHQIWGTFSVMDHMRPGAFLSQVVMYDRLLIPVPPDPDRAETPEDRKFAVEQQERWRKNWAPTRQAKLLEILTEDIAVPVEWNRRRHKMWAAEYEKSKRDAAVQFSEVLAGWKTGETLLQEVPAMAQGAIAVSPYDSLEDLKRELGITEVSTLEERLQAGRDLPGELVSTIIGREFLVPDDPDRNEFDLLREAVNVVRETDYRTHRAAFHAVQQRFIEGSKTDLESITEAVNEMAHHLAEIDKIVHKRGFWNGVRRAFFFTQLLADVIPGGGLVRTAVNAAISVGKFTSSEQLRNPAAPQNVAMYGALLLDTQCRIALTLEGERK